VIQDIQFALTYQKCLRLSFAPFDDRLRHWWVAKPCTERDWVNRAIWLLAETVEFCYNGNVSRYENDLRAMENALKQKILEWETTRPEIFTPLHVSPPEPGRGKPFPVVWYTSLCHCEFCSVGVGLELLLTFVSSYGYAAYLSSESIVAYSRV
jgi:hypothetical protein